MMISRRLARNARVCVAQAQFRRHLCRPVVAMAQVRCVAGSTHSHAPVLVGTLLHRRAFSTERPPPAAADAAATSTTTSASGANAQFDAAAQAASPGNGFTETVSSSSGLDLGLQVSEGVAAAAGEAAKVLGNWPSDYMVRLLEMAHDVTGIPYWGVIMGATIAMRLALFPLAVSTAKGTARLQLAKPEMEAAKEIFEKRSTGDKVAVARYQKDIQGIMAKHQVQPLAMFKGPVANVFVFVPTFFALQKMGDFVPGLSQEGFAWVSNLAAADPTYVLPVVVTAGFLGLFEIGMDGVKMDQGAQMKVFMRFLPFIFFPITAKMPAAVLLYWGASNIASIGQTLLLKHPKFKQKYGIPNIPGNTMQTNAPSLTSSSTFKRLFERYEETKKARQVAEADILRGSKTVPPPPPSAKPVITYAVPPKQRKGAVSAAQAHAHHTKSTGQSRQP